MIMRVTGCDGTIWVGEPSEPETNSNCTSSYGQT